MTNEKRRAMFVGRWQPWHNGHAWLIDRKLALGVPVLILVRDTVVSEANPFSTRQVVDIIRKVYAGKDVEVMPIPDIESVNWGRGVGYEVNEFIPPEDICRISATEIRKCIRSADDSWKDKVDPKVHGDIEDVLG